MPETFWNGLPCVARRVTAIVAPWEDGDPPRAWWKHLAGMRRRMVEVTVPRALEDGVFYLDDDSFEPTEEQAAYYEMHGMTVRSREAGQGWAKVTEGRGSPQWAHSDAKIVPGSVVARGEEGSELVAAMLRDELTHPRGPGGMFAVPEGVRHLRKLDEEKNVDDQVGEQVSLMEDGEVEARPFARLLQLKEADPDAWVSPMLHLRMLAALEARIRMNSHALALLERVAAERDVDERGM